ncbi:DUF3710 domain-containing protein [Rhodococcus erythropolis]|uniref:DUF3710 domain-containing protein n=1 Tax=Rhodococcus erythropolis TaxID=1833 RepID=UPI0039822065
MSGQWSQVADALAESLRNDGATVRVEVGPWGEEVAAPDADLRFIGVGGRRWIGPRNEQFLQDSSLIPGI